MSIWIALAGIIVLGTGCTLAPRYARPSPPVRETWPSGPAYRDLTAVTNTPCTAETAWREIYTDAGLRGVIEMALTNNRDLRIASMSVERARAYYGIQRAGLLPAVDAVGSASKARTPGDLASSGKAQTTERYDANLGVAAWEIDFFGRIRSLKDRALEEFYASEQARRSVQILLVSSVAQAYFALAADRANLRLSQNTLEAQQAAFDLVQRRYDLGLVPELELFRAQTPLEVARRDVALYQQRVAEGENALNLLAGGPVPIELLPADLDAVCPPRGVSAGLSSAVLLNRPDVQEAESLLKAANADLGAARAAFFPRVTLTAALGTASGELSGLFEAGSGAWSYAPKIVMPIFDARTWSAHKAARVQRELAVAQYEKAIQSAFREVADALAAQGSVGTQLGAQQSLVKALSETYRLAQSRFDKGIDSYLGVLDAQRSLFAAQQALNFLRLQKLSNDARLYAVLGGGWTAESGNPSSVAKEAAHGEPPIPGQSQ